MTCHHRQSAVWLLLGLLERIAAFSVLLALAPLMLIVAISTALLSRMSPLIAHRRLGLGGSPLWVLKFRTMWRRGARPSGRFAFIEYIVDEKKKSFVRDGARALLDETDLDISRLVSYWGRRTALL